MVEGWAKFEKVCSEVGAGELPQLLHCLSEKKHFFIALKIFTWAVP